MTSTAALCGSASVRAGSPFIFRRSLSSSWPSGAIAPCSPPSHWALLRTPSVSQSFVALFARRGMAASTRGYSQLVWSRNDGCPVDLPCLLEVFDACVESRRDSAVEGF